MKTKILLIVLFINLIGLIGYSQTKPLFYYPFNGNTNDESGNGNSCTNFGATLTTDRFGNENSAYSFDGKSNYMKVKPTVKVDSLEDFTISLWFSHNGWNETYGIYSTDLSIIGLQYIVNGHSASELNYNAIEGIGVGLILNSDSTVDIDAYYHWGKTDPANNRVVQRINYPLHDTKWTHIVWMRKNGKDYSYINGQLTVNPNYLSNNPSSDFIDQQHPLYFGSANGLLTKNYQFKGKIDDVRIYNSALDESEITNIYSAQPINITVNSIKEEINGNDGAIDISVNGGVEPYKYKWSNNTSSEDLSNGNATNYTVTVTDSYLNTKIQSFTINKLDPLSISLTELKNEISGNDGSIDIKALGGKLPYVYSWSNGLNSEDINKLTSGTYTLTLTDFYSNSISKSFKIKSLLSISGVISGNNEVINDGYVIAFIKTDKGIQPYSYANIQNNGTYFISNLPSSNYILYAIPNGTNLTKYIPTYYYNNNSWETAYSIDLVGNVINANINLLELKNHPEIGKNNINGKIEYEDQSFYLFQDQTLEPKYYSISCQPVFMFKDGNIIATTLTDKNGNFIFNNILDGTYDLVIINPGQKESRKRITIPFDTQKTLRLNYPGNSLVDESIIKYDNIIIYPNPATSTINISNKSDICVFSLQNQLLIKAFNTSILDVSKLVPGSYIIQVENKRSIFIKR